VAITDHHVAITDHRVAVTVEPRTHHVHRCTECCLTVWTIYQGVPGTGVLDTGLARSAAFCSSVSSGSFVYK